MSEIDPHYDDYKARLLFAEYKRKAAVMREICDLRHDKALRISFWRDFVTVSASALFLGLSFFGSSQVASMMGASEGAVSLALNVATFFLLSTSIWQISSDRTTAFQNYRGIQSFASISNKIDYISSGLKLDDKSATYWVKEITQMYESAARDIPRISDKEHSAAKKRL